MAVGAFKGGGRDLGVRSCEGRPAEMLAGDLGLAVVRAECVGKTELTSGLGLSVRGERANGDVRGAGLKRRVELG